MRRSAVALPILLLAMDVPSDMGGHVRARRRSIQGYGSSLSLLEARSVHLSLLRLLPLLAPASLLLAPLPLRPVPQFQVNYPLLVYSPSSCFSQLRSILNIGFRVLKGSRFSDIVLLLWGI